MTVYLMDPYLLDYSGHCFNYLNIVQAKLFNKNVNVSIIGNENCSLELKQKGIVPLFSKNLLAPEKYRIKNIFSISNNKIFNYKQDKNISNFIYNFNDIIQQRKIDKNDFVFINSLRPYEFLGLASWVSKQKTQNCPNIIIILHFTTQLRNFSGLVFAEHYRRAFKLINQSHLQNKIMIYADTLELVNEFKLLGATDIKLAPIPSTLEDKKNQLSRSVRNHSKSIVVSFLGQPRDEKGFSILPQISILLEKYIRINKIEFKVQASHAKGKLLEKNLELLRTSGVVIISEELNQDEYFNLVQETDIALLPYTGYSYRNQSAGVFADAISLGKIVVTSPNTWMGNVLKSLGSQTYVDRGTPIMYANKIIEITENFDKFRLEFQNNADYWREIQDVDKFIKSWFVFDDINTTDPESKI